MVETPDLHFGILVSHLLLIGPYFSRLAPVAAFSALTGCLLAPGRVSLNLQLYGHKENKQMIKRGVKEILAGQEGETRHSFPETDSLDVPGAEMGGCFPVKSGIPLALQQSWLILSSYLYRLFWADSVF